MATNYPTSLDTFSNPTSGSALNSPSHSAQHANINDAMVQVQTKLGTTPSAGAHVIGEFVDFTPTFTGLTLGNATVTARYALVNNLCFWQVRVVLGSTSSVTGSVFVNYPFTSDETYLGAIGGQVQLEDASGTDYFGMLYRSNATKALLSTLRSDTQFARPDAVDATTPFTWTTGDRIHIEDTMRVA